MQSFQLEEDIDKIACTEPVVPLGQVNAVCPSIKDAGVVGEKALDIDRRMRSQLCIVDAGEPEGVERGQQVF